LEEILERLQSTLTEQERQQVGPILRTSGQNVPLTDWFRAFLRYDPVADLKLVKAPVLILTGSKDIQAKAEPNVHAIEAALAAGGNPDVTAEILPGLNHLFQTAKTGRVEEYATIEETFAPSALEKIADWIAARTQAPK
jgi:fermentation-respiration switch protein FrsA (DUF1100 family)